MSKNMIINQVSEFQLVFRVSRFAISFPCILSCLCFFVPLETCHIHRVWTTTTKSVDILAQVRNTPPRNFPGLGVCPRLFLPSFFQAPRFSPCEPGVWVRDSGCFYLEDGSSGCVSRGLWRHRCFQEAVMGWQSRLCSLLSLMVRQIRCVSLQRFLPMWV